MKETSIAGVRAQTDARKKGADTAVKQLRTTEKGGVRLADQLGAVKTMLTDTNAKVSAERNVALDSVKKAASDDAALVAEQERLAGDEEREVSQVERQAAGEQGKAESAKSSDSRMKDGGKMAQQIAAARQVLEGSKAALRDTSRTAKTQRETSVKEIDAATGRNRS